MIREVLTLPPEDRRREELRMYSESQLRLYIEAGLRFMSEDMQKPKHRAATLREYAVNLLIAAEILEEKERGHDAA